nr:MAG TPA: hypothetical protein [Caudoviricetes sp.]
MALPNPPTRLHHRDFTARRPDMETGICRDLRTTCARSDYRVNDITALSARQGAAAWR